MSTSPHIVGGASAAVLPKADRSTYAAMPAIRPLAGFDSKNKRAFFIPRSLLEVPPQLLQTVLLRLDYWLAKHRPLSTSTSAFEDTDAGPVEKSLCALGFLELLTELRVVFLQDSVFLRDHYQLHLIWDLPVFYTPQYGQFATDLRAAVERAKADDPADLRIQAVLPDLAAQMQSHSQDVGAKIVQMQHTLETSVATKADMVVARSSARWPPR